MAYHQVVAVIAVNEVGPEVAVSVIVVIGAVVVVAADVDVVVDVAAAVVGDCADEGDGPAVVVVVAVFPAPISLG